MLICLSPGAGFSQARRVANTWVGAGERRYTNQAIKNLYHKLKNSAIHDTNSIALVGQAISHTSANEPTLCKEQRDLVDLILNGQNVFYTGSAGTGESTALRAFVKELNKNEKKVNIIAPTGRVPCQS